MDNIPAPTNAPAPPPLPLYDQVVEALRTCYDPEVPVDIYELGLIYKIDVGANNSVAIDMTLTSAACPLTDVIEDQTMTALVGAGLVNEARINWVWNPPWGPDKITEDGREQLRALGFTV